MSLENKLWSVPAYSTAQSLARINFNVRNKCSDQTLDCLHCPLCLSIGLAMCIALRRLLRHSFTWKCVDHCSICWFCCLNLGPSHSLANLSLDPVLLLPLPSAAFLDRCTLLRAPLWLLLARFVLECWASVKQTLMQQMHCSQPSCRVQVKTPYSVTKNK